VPSSSDASPAPSWLTPQWPAPVGVRALTTLRSGGVSQGDFASLNLALHVQDDPVAVAENRQRIIKAAKIPAEPLWLNQVHGTEVIEAIPHVVPPSADASVAHRAGQVCTIMTADCLPVLFCDDAGRHVAAAHAGWRGLVGGVLANTVAVLDVAPDRLMAWLGPAIEPAAFEVGDEVRTQFLARSSQSDSAFSRNERGRWQADLYELARQELLRLGVLRVYGGGFHCFGDAERFFSFRRQARTGRMASMIWIE
jgi:YfiH family protein